jgi:hypothetical protein
MVVSSLAQVVARRSCRVGSHCSTHSCRSRIHRRCSAYRSIRSMPGVIVVGSSKVQHRPTRSLSPLHRRGAAAAFRRVAASAPSLCLGLSERRPERAGRGCSGTRRAGAPTCRAQPQLITRTLAAPPCSCRDIAPRPQPPDSVPFSRNPHMGQCA